MTYPSDVVFVLYRVEGGRREPIGWFDLMAEAVCALDEERQKEDVRLEIEMEVVHGHEQQQMDQRKQS